MLADSNIIYAARPEHGRLRQFIAEQITTVSAITYIEVLGYHRLDKAQQNLYHRLFQSLVILPISMPVVEKAVHLRQQRRMSLGDALIAATSMVHDLTVATRNVSDFHWIDGLSLVNPFDMLGLSNNHEQ
jgi:hypothetical protein